MSSAASVVAVTTTLLPALAFAWLWFTHVPDPRYPYAKLVTLLVLPGLVGVVCVPTSIIAAVIALRANGDDGPTYNRVLAAIAFAISAIEIVAFLVVVA